ncbi:uncharacterized protein [Aegilops tauschii subsp. strangulata]|uniref:uncharacterized protein n=1 Tax=Aegilops tauschii subsp. strangulata TaxID=200361 RepID=UPI003CC89CD6
MWDFNLISRADEMSKQNVNLRLLRTFRAAIDDLHLKELPLKGHRFTWSNERINTTHTKIDKVLKPQTLPNEFKFRAFLKARLLALAAIDRIKWRQKSRLVGIRAGDASTKLFFIRANGRRRKNHIPYLHKDDGTVASNHNDKAGILLRHFTDLLGSSSNPTQVLNCDFLGLARTNLSHLDRPIDLDELQAAINNMDTEKAPGPDGFIGLFFRKCWHIIKMDLLNALNKLSTLDGKTWSLLNSAFIVLIPKKEAALPPSDFRPISLTHSVAKILGKLPRALHQSWTTSSPIVKVHFSKSVAFKRISSIYRLSSSSYTMH